MKQHSDLFAKLVASGTVFKEALTTADKAYHELGIRCQDLENVRDVDCFLGTLELARVVLGMEDIDFARASGHYVKTVKAWDDKRKVPSRDARRKILSTTAMWIQSKTGTDYWPGPILRAFYAEEDRARDDYYRRLKESGGAKIPGWR